MKKLNVALYLRLSKDDGDESREESNSITNQRNLLRTFVKSHEKMVVYDEYIDDGFSGANFQRPSFIRMIADMELGLIDCIITKDLSRFGRDYIEAGKYIQKIFPNYGVRFIAVNDNYDSATADQAEANLVLPVKNFVNDSYCRDISTKVRTSQHIKRLNGEYIGSFPVFGYKKDPDNKNRLIIDAEASEIIKMIFQWKLKGFSSKAIADKLNEFKIDSPLTYKKRKGSKFKTSFNNSKDTKWTAASVGRVLSNPVYTGILEQGKTSRINYKLKKEVDKPKEDWIIVEGTHEAIISKEIFANVQRLLKRDLRLEDSKKNPHIFSGMLFCADCGRALIRRVNNYKGNKKVFFICSSYNNGKSCTRHSIAEDILKEIVFLTLNKHIFLTEYYWERIRKLANSNFTEKEALELDNRIKLLEVERKKYEALKSSLYEDMKDGLIDEKEFASFRSNYTLKIDEIEQAMEKQQELIGKVFKRGIDSEEKLNNICQFKNLTELDRMSMVLFIDKIIVSENKEVEITFNHEDELNIISNILEEAENFIPQKRREVV